MSMNKTCAISSVRLDGGHRQPVFEARRQDHAHVNLAAHSLDQPGQELVILGHGQGLGGGRL